MLNSNFIFQEDAAKLLLKIINKKGIINLGGQVKLCTNLQKNSIKILKKFFKR